MIFLKVCSKVCKKWTLLGSRRKLCKCKLDSSQLGISGFTFRTVAGEDVLKDPVHSFCPLDPVISPGTGLSLFEHFEVFGWCHPAKCNVELAMTERQCCIFPMARCLVFSIIFLRAYPIPNIFWSPPIVLASIGVGHSKKFIAKQQQPLEFQHQNNNTPALEKWMSSLKKSDWRNRPTCARDCLQKKQKRKNN